MAAVEFRILGPVEVRTPDAGEVRIPAGQQRVLLASLLVDAGRVVSTDTLAQYLWGEPDGDDVGSPTTIRSYVRRLRGSLAAVDRDAHALIQHRPPGYLLAAGPDEVDLLRFRALTERARGLPERDPAPRAELLGRALALWRGEPLADIRSEVLRRDVVPALTEERLLAVEQWAEAQFALGRYQDTLSELAGHVRRHPLRERFTAQLMRALHRAGRQAEALECYQRTRALLDRELGVSPGPELERTYLAILRDEAPAPGETAPRAAHHTHPEPAARIVDPLPEKAPERPPTAPGRTPPAAAPQVPAPQILAPQVPAELPADATAFTGRRGELDWLRTALTETRTVVLAGAAGVGKTALAVHAAHQTRDAFPDGQLFIDLRGHEAQAVHPGEALRRFLRALGEADQSLPADPDERAARYRSLLADRRMLIVLDNAGSARQVRPLLPGSSGSLALVTSRRRLDGLAAIDHARQLSLDVLSDDDAAALLRRTIGADRARGQDRAIRDLARLCDRLPLALRIAAARLLAYPRRPVDWLVTELSGEQRRLANLSLADDEAAAVPAAFSSAYEALDPAAARIFRLLGLHPCPQLTAPAVAALAGSTVASVEPALDSLLSAHLLQETADPPQIADCQQSADRQQTADRPETADLQGTADPPQTPVPGDAAASGERADRPTRGYLLHDLVHLYARQRAHADESEVERATATARLLDFYLAAADAAGRPHQAYYPPPERRIEHPPADPLPFATDAEGLAWLSAQYPALREATGLAARLGDHERTWQLADSLWFLQQRRRQYEDWLELHSLGLAAARQLDDGVATQRMLRRLAAACAETRRFAEAAAYNDEALALARASGDPRTETQVLNNLGVLHSQMGERDREIDYLSQAVALARAHGIREMEAMGLANIAYSLSDLGRHDEAIGHAEEALRIHQTLPEGVPRASALGILGRAQRLGGRYAQSLASFREGLTVSERTGASYMQAECLDGIGLALAHLSGPDAGLPHLERALDLFTAIGHRRADDVRAELARLRGQGRPEACQLGAGPAGHSPD